MEARAKINLYLAVGARRPDGYHDIRTIFHSVSLADTLTIRPADSLIVSCATPGCPEGRANIVYRAAELLAGRGGITPAASIVINKRIPMQAGLGGGSADAASALVGLNALWKAGASLEELAAIGLKLGADVPFCVTGGAAYAEGVGDRLSPLPALSDGWIVILKPDTNVSTREAYAALDANARPVGPDPAAALSAVRRRDLSQLASALYNDFEPVALNQNPTIRRAHTALRKWLPAALLCGSGAALFGLASSEEEAALAAAALEQDQWDARAARFAHTGWTMTAFE